ncbi:hypothetical protein EXIGLDRAFT_154074 [Exidia glandulosa HHB12029]|uniref:Uncharacterized protein n=1 Tax=Exidia glandulosa HHB12029 TaxID=1314781 RepID=A0A165QHG4_EXIGL|nr:hypothetical protein EXIGLDRAFT_154074 [Exidia glandulosa HHB12029]
MSTNMATMAFIRGRIDTLIDRLATLLLSTSNQTLAGYKSTLDGISHALATVYDDTLTPAFAREIRDQLAQMRLGLPAVHAAAVADRRTHPAFQADWFAYSRQMDEYLGFIVNRVPELSSGPLDAPRAFPVTDDRAPSFEYDHRQRRARSKSHAAPSATAAARAYHPSSGGRPAGHVSVPAHTHRSSHSISPQSREVPPFIPPPPQHAEQMHYNYARRPQYPPQRFAQPLYDQPHRSQTPYPAASIPPHLAHVYAQSPAMAAARFS